MSYTVALQRALMQSFTPSGCSNCFQVFEPGSIVDWVSGVITIETGRIKIRRNQHLIDNWMGFYGEAGQTG
ncbi:MAG: hypothetical protein JAY64_04955 [Candidatus Thiodiazotropha weberae]|nr:hypothetical protein [Candidatus Thiodiazotropha lotti]MCG8011035.1 hypothetical protein [Candidatus Thiodiazotropha lotti]MCW4210498.1 hypothetical protein [Candidatus Thiodiazotropha lotti]MCW4216415.1 hypothetical protein [Candidatus Thiodiazotropha lotti]